MRCTTFLFASSLLLLACGSVGSSLVVSDDPPSVSLIDPVVLRSTVPVLSDAGSSDASADRIAPIIQEVPVPSTTEAPPVGLFGLPFAPEGLSDCEEMAFYRIQAGLPDRFQQLGWRESNCRNEEGVRTFCCYGYWQMYFTMHVSDHQGGQVYVRCEVDEVSDYNGDTPLDKQKQACTAKGIFELVGYSAWSL